MTIKDWILLLVPVCCNGIVVFMVQKVYEKRQKVRDIKYQYILSLRNIIDNTLKLHAEATRKANEKNVDNALLIRSVQAYIDCVLDVYYYYIQNKSILESLDNNMEKIADKVTKLSKDYNEPNIDMAGFSQILNEIRDELMIIKDLCINLSV